MIKLATVIPRTQELAIQEKKYNLQLAEMTAGRVQIKTYYGGSAGDDATVMRKMRVGQMDGSLLGTDVVSQFVRQCTVLIAPQTFFNYRQVDAVRKALSPEFDKEAYGNGFRIMNWWDAGRVRIFSKRPITSLADLRKGRPWLYPQSTLLKEFYSMVGATGVPIDLAEVYGGLQTDMIDTVWISSVLGVALRWASATQYVSSAPVNIIQGAFLLRRETWESLSKEDQSALDTVVATQAEKTQEQFRAGDDRAYARLLERGMKPVAFSKLAEWQDAGRKLRQKMVGRTYTKELLDRVEAITNTYPGAE